jgi:putative ABC transport system permease protein
MAFYWNDEYEGFKAKIHRHDKKLFPDALRQFIRHKMFSALNVFCLAIGISFCLLIGQYILHENAVNANIKNIHQQY